MSKKEHIDTISAKMWEAYFSGVILTSEKEKVEAFLQQYPEFLEEFNGVTPDDVASVKRITKNVNAKVADKTGKKKIPYVWWGVAATVVIVGTFIVNYQNSSEGGLVVSNDKVEQDSVLVDEIIENQVVVFEEAQKDDTIFSFEMKANKLQIVELPPSPAPSCGGVIEEKSLDVVFPDVESDNIVQEEPEEDVVIPNVVYEKSFASEVDYIQSVHIEENFYSQSKTVGKTTSYASPIKGHSYENEGMPSFKGGEEELLSYINNELKSDELLDGIRKKMKANLSFIVTNKGKVKDVLVQNCNHRQLGLSLMKVMENMPDWSPSEFKGKKGKVHYVLKIVFE